MEPDRFNILFDQAPVCVHEIDTAGRLLAMNPAGLAMMGVGSEDAIRGRDYLTLVSRSDRERVRRLMADAFAGQACAFEFCAAASVALARAQGAPATARPRHFTSCFIASPDAHGRVDRLIGISQDISPHPEAEAELRRLNRAHAVLARCNRSLARAIGERGLLNAFCTNLVEVGGYCFAWVGYAGRKHPPRVRMVAHAGQEHADFTAEALAWANTGDRPSACRMAVESGRPVVLRDIANEPDLAPWADTALRYGYRSMIALPLRAEGTAFGNFSIFCAEVDAFNEPEVALLAELAQDLAFGISTARARAIQAQELRQLRDEIEADARKRIAATLHDVVGQSMQAVNLGLKRVRQMAVKDAQVPTELLDQLIGEVGTAIRELRDLSQELRPLFLERLPLLDAVRFHCSETAARAGIAIRVQAADASFDLSERVKEQCFLGFREALSNAIRHAKASRVDVILDIPSPGRLRLAVIDDGVGFDPHGVFQRPVGLGLCLIRERAESVFGHAQIHSTPGKGTSVRISVPLAGSTAP